MKKSYHSRLHFYSLFTTFILMVVVLLCVTACDAFYSKDKYLKDFERFVAQTEQNFINYTNDDWDNTDLEYNQFTSELYQKVYSKLTVEDQKQIGKLKARYQTTKLKSEINGTIQSIKDDVIQAKGALEEVVDSINN